MKKKFLLSVVLILLAVALAACGRATPVDTVGASTPAAQALVGTWYWLGQPYYVLEPDGTGTMGGFNIRWAANNSVLSICSTPNTCGTHCSLPTEWQFQLSGDELVLSGTGGITSRVSFTYTRR